MHGHATAGEAARLAGVSRQLVEQWGRSAGINWRKARAAYLGGEWRKLVIGERPATKKAKLRSLANSAKAQWDARNGKA